MYTHYVEEAETKQATYVVVTFAPALGKKEH